MYRVGVRCDFFLLSHALYIEYGTFGNEFVFYIHISCHVGRENMFKSL